MKKEDCIFCKLAQGEIPSTTLYEDDDFRVFFDVNPATLGHCLIVPKEHYDDIFSMDEEVAGKLFVLAAKVAKELKKELKCDGLNLLQNNGVVAGQTVFHFHVHIIPRYEGDQVVIHSEPGTPDMEALAALADKVGKALA